MTNEKDLTTVEFEFIMEEFNKTNDRIKVLEEKFKFLNESELNLLSDSEKEAIVEHSKKIKLSKNKLWANIIHKAKKFTIGYVTGLIVMTILQILSLAFGIK